MLDTLVVGAGLSGLACARTLQAAGQQVALLEKSRGVGGRCATRRLRGQPVDYGVTFLHGTSKRFVQALAALPADERIHWPTRVAGTGPVCAPGAFEDGITRVALRSGVNAFPKWVAEGLTIHRQQRAANLAIHDDIWTVTSESGDSLRARCLVLALPLEQCHALLQAMPVSDANLRGILGLMGMTGSSSCLTVAALYSLETPEPDFDVLHPPLSSPVALISHDSSKRNQHAYRALVVQARVGWSRTYLEESKTAWGDSLLNEAADILGDWVKSPLERHEHRWRFARVNGAPAFRHAVLTSVQGATLGLAGEGFSEGGGVQGAFTSGLDLAERLLEAR